MQPAILILFLQDAFTQMYRKRTSWDYLGKTIQVIPHVTNEIKDFISIGEDEVDFMLCEIGGTIGDIEGLPFLKLFDSFLKRNLEVSAFLCI